MSPRVSKYECPSWEVYPRIYYFYRRYTDLLTRFKRVTGLLPKCFHDDRVVSELDKIRDNFDSGVRFNVIGKEIDLKDLVFSTQDKSDTTTSPKVEVFICHTDIQTLDLEGLEDLNALLHTLTEDIPSDSINDKVIFISCGVENSYTVKEVDDFNAAIQENSKGLTLRPENILIGPEQSSLKTKISDELEKIVIAGFHKISAYLQTFDLNDKGSSHEKDNILETQAVVNAIRNVLRNPYTKEEFMAMITEEKEGERCPKEVKEEKNDKRFPAEVNEEKEGKIFLEKVKEEKEGQRFQEKGKEDTEGEQFLEEVKEEKEDEILSAQFKEDNEGERFLEEVIKHLCRAIKSAAVNQLAKKHNIRPEICNELLHEIQFEEALSVSVSKNIRYHLGKKLKDTNKRNAFDFLLYPLQETLKPVFEMTDGKLSAMRRLSMTIRRLIFEISGYLKQSTVIAENQVHNKDTPVKVTENLRRDILKIKGVYGLGSIYGKLEIHLDEKKEEVGDMEKTSSKRAKVSEKCQEETLMETDKVENQQKDEMQENDILDVKSEIALQLRKHNFHSPYSIRDIRSKAKEMNGSFEPGDTLHCQTKQRGKFTKGTLGTFLNSRNGTLYGLTSAHVVEGTKRVFVHKEGLNPLSISQHVVKTGQDECRLIDIAALKVIQALQESSKSSLENNIGRVTKARLEQKSPENLVGRYVNKFGAETGLTQGVILSVDYSKIGPKAEDYIVIIDPLAASSSKDLEDLVGTFSESLLVSLSQNEARQQAEDSDTHMEAPELPPTETSEEENVDCTTSRKRKLENKDSETSSDEDNDENKVFAEADKVMVAGDRILCQRNTRSDIETSSDKYMSHQNDIQGFTDVQLYVRFMNERDLDQCRNDADGVFAKPGDSGSAICTQNLSHKDQTYSAIAMLAAGDMEVESHSGKKALSFMLKDGLKKLHEHCQIEF